MPRTTRSSGGVDAALLGACVLLALAIRVLPDNLSDPLAGALRRSAAAPLAAIHQRAQLVRNAWLTYDQRSFVRDSLALRAMSVSALESENERLRQLLGLARQLEWGFVPAEALHNRGVGEEYTLTLTAGSAAGARPYSPVVAPEGLIGMVYSTDPSISMAILWPHPDFRVSAMAADGSAFGIVRAHLGGDAARYLLEMSGVPFRSELKPGAVIISSGLGGTYPRGIPIGTVLRELKTSEGWARTYLVRPSVLPPDVTSVMVLTPRRVAAGVESVWAGQVDSATRALLAAADSVARADSLAELARRRAAQASAAPVAAAAPVDTPATRPPAPVRRASTVRRDTVTSDTAAREPVIRAPARPVSRDTAARDTAVRVQPPRADTPRVRPPARRDTTPPDTLRRPAARRDTTPADTGRAPAVRRDTSRRDTATRVPVRPPVRRDTARSDTTVRRDTLPPGQP